MHSLRSLRRSKGKSLLALSVSLVLVLFLSAYSQSIAQHKRNLASLHQSITVTGQITNYNGSETDGLAIPDTAISALEASDYIANSYYTRTLLLFNAPLGEMDFEEFQNRLWKAGRLVGANTITAIPEFSAQSAPLPEFWGDYDETLFASSQRVCILSEDLLQSLDLKLGDCFEFTLVENAKIIRANLANCETTLQIVGVYSGPVRQRAYCPWGTISEFYRELKLSTRDSARFELKNTQQLGAFKAMLEKLHFLSPYDLNPDDVISQDRLGFIINDRILANATGGIEGYIAFMTALYPLIYILSACIGFVVSYLLIRLRKPEFALMRSLGASQGQCFSTFLGEQVFLSLLGAVPGMLIAMLVNGIELTTAKEIYSSLVYLAFYLAGSAIAVATMNRGNVIQILTAKE